MHTPAHGTPAASQAPCNHRRHSPATARIQRRFESWELEHLRALAVAQAERIEQLERDLVCAEDAADYWSRSHHSLAEHLDNDTSDARSIGLTVSGELLVVVR